MLKGNIAMPVGGRTAGKTAVLLLFPLLLLLQLFPADRAVAQTPPAAPAAASSSGLKLIGTIRSSSFSGAVFSDNAGIQSFFRLYDQLPEGYRLVQISSKSILIKNADGIQYELFISQDIKTAGQTVPPPTSMEPVKQEEVAPRARRNAHRTRNRSQNEETAPDE